MRTSRYHNPYLATLDRPVAQRLCDSPGCGQAGLFRAPRNRDNLKEYYWFCLEHVRDYNENWNYLDGLSAEEIEACIRRASVWDRPSWSPATARRFEQKVRESVRRAFFAEDGEEAETTNGKPAFSPVLGEREALLVLGLEPGVEFAQGDEAAVVESVKAASEVYAPVGGEVTEANEALAESPGLVNSEPTGDGWFFKLRIADPKELDQLMSAEEYKAYVKDLD